MHDWAICCQEAKFYARLNQGKAGVIESCLLGEFIWKHNGGGEQGFGGKLGAGGRGGLSTREMGKEIKGFWQETLSGGSLEQCRCGNVGGNKIRTWGRLCIGEIPRKQNCLCQFCEQERFA